GAVAEGVAHAHFAAVHVPAGGGGPAAGLARRLTGPAVDGDEADSRFDEPAGQQQVLSERMHAIAIAHGSGFALQFEDLTAAGAVGEFGGTVVQVVPIAGGANAVLVSRVA